MLVKPDCLHQTFAVHLGDQTKTEVVDGQSRPVDHCIGRGGKPEEANCSHCRERMLGMKPVDLASEMAGLLDLLVQAGRLRGSYYFVCAVVS